MPRYNFEEKLVAGIDRRMGTSQKLGELQKKWKDVANETAKDLVAQGIYSAEELKADEDYVRREQLRRDKEGTSEEKEYPEKVDATIAIMKLFDQDLPAEEQLNVIPVHDRDKLATGVRFLLSEKGKAIGICIDTVLDARGEKAIANSIAAAINSADIEKISTSDIKYVDDKNIRGQLIPKIKFVLRKDRAEKLADIVAESDPKKLNQEEKAIKDEIKLEMQIQINKYLKGLDDLIEKIKLGKGPERADLSKIKILREKLQSFKELF